MYNEIIKLNNEFNCLPVAVRPALGTSKGRQLQLEYYCFHVLEDQQRSRGNSVECSAVRQKNNLLKCFPTYAFDAQLSLMQKWIQKYGLGRKGVRSEEGLCLSPVKSGAVHLEIFF